jgi:tetratricopeptide (TPR) repeat protein
VYQVALLVCCAFAAQQPGPQGGVPDLTGPGNSTSGGSEASVIKFNEMVEQGWELAQAGRHGELRQHLEKLLRIAEPLGPAAKATTLTWLGFTYAALWRFADAERNLVQCIELRKRLWGSANQSDFRHAGILSVLAGVEVDLGRYSQAEKYLDEAGKIWRSIPDSRKDPKFAVYLNNLGMLRYGRGQYLEAERSLREAVSIFQESTPADDSRQVQAMAHLAGTLSWLNFHIEADGLSAEALARFRNKIEREPLLGSELLSIRALVLRNAKRGREAKSVEALVRDLKRRSGTDHVVDFSQLGRSHR